MVACITPVELDHVHARFCFTQPKAQAEGERAGVAKAIIRDICKQFDQDKVIWDRQRYEPNALICEGTVRLPSSEILQPILCAAW